MSLSSVPNTFDDDTHAALDEKVNGYIGPCLVDKHPSYYIPLLQALLQTIVEFSNGTLDPGYLDFRASRVLIATQPELVAMLNAAWKSGSYRRIRNLEILQPPKSVC